MESGLQVKNEQIDAIRTESKVMTKLKMLIKISPTKKELQIDTIVIDDEAVSIFNSKTTRAATVDSNQVTATIKTGLTVNASRIKGIASFHLSGDSALSLT